MEIGLRRWSAALLGAVLIHLVIAALILLQMPRSGAQSADLGGHEITLVLVGDVASSDTPPLDQTDDAQTINAPATISAEMPPEDVEFIDDASNPVPAVMASTVTEVVAGAPEAEAVDAVEVAEVIDASQAVALVEPTLVRTVNATDPAQDTQAAAPRENEAAVASEMAKTVTALPSAPAINTAAVAAPVSPDALVNVEQALPEPPDADAIAVAEAVPVEVPVEEAEAIEQETVEINPVAPHPADVEVVDVASVVAAQMSTPMPPIRPSNLPQVARGAPEHRAEPVRRSAQTEQPSTRVSSSAAARASMPGITARADRAEMQSYTAELAAALRARMRYPGTARARRIEGVATVQFTIDSSGRILRSTLIGSAGNESLDQAALATVRPGTSLPAPPRSHQGSMTVTVPLRFSIR